ncbi:amino acid adenylation enzyme thioester reductase family protein [Lasius niger]|uniref:Amino acid adenylation enzyme thioester reductase family protein n=1 Tax=Lasius niger TaxID=67767 RepID=A0A0J7JVT8_LASNI|nr:amino acid adenylation enzyme thioester reductase family protein [Lasius niger]
MQDNEMQDNPDKEQVPHTVIATCPMPTTPGSSLSAAASLPYLGPTGRCKKQKKTDETAELFKETLSNLNKSIASAPVLPTLAPNDPDSLIGKNVELALKSLPNLQLTLQFRKKFRALIQDCEEAAALYESDLS